MVVAGAVVPLTKKDLSTTLFHYFRKIAALGFAELHCKNSKIIKKLIARQLMHCLDFMSFPKRCMPFQLRETSILFQ